MIAVKEEFVGRVSVPVWNEEYGCQVAVPLDEQTTQEQLKGFWAVEEFKPFLVDTSATLSNPAKAATEKPVAVKAVESAKVDLLNT